MTDSTPEALLQSALEKIVYFEARSGQLASDLEQARVEAERFKTELGHSSQREIELRKALAELEVRLNRAHLEREEVARLNEVLRRERTELISKVLDASRIQRSQTPDADGYDLAQFIAMLRQEVLPGVKAESRGADRATGLETPAGVVAMAHELHAQGRLAVSQSDLGTLEAGHPFDGKSEETLFGFSVRELSAPDASSRVRAAERLLALRHKAAAPALASALNLETEPKVQVALLAAMAVLAGPEAVALVVPLTSSPAADVRVAALRALLALDASHAAPHLAAAMKDNDKAVRRRASLLALGLKGDEALELGTKAVHDADADVRALAVLVLGASGAEAARPLLMEAMRDHDVRVRRTASQTLTRLLGQDVTSLANLDDAQRRREVRRLVGVPSNPVRSTHQRIEDVLRRASAATSPAPEAPVRVPVTQTVVESSRPAAVLASPARAAAPARTAVAVLEVVESSEPQRAAILSELRAAIRGKGLDELAASQNLPAEVASHALSSLIASAHVVRRGHKYFVA